MLLITGVVFPLLQSCSTKNENFVVNLTASIIEKDNVDRKKIITIEYKNMGSGSGADGQYGTQDDDIYRYTVTRDGAHVLDPANEIEIVVFDSPGNDDIWFTEDDGVQYSDALLKFSDDEQFNVGFYSYDYSSSLSNEIQKRNLTNEEALNYLLLSIGPKGFGNSMNIDRLPVIVNDYYPFYNGNQQVYKSYFLNGKEYQVSYQSYFNSFQIGVNNYGITGYTTKTIDSETGNEIVTSYSRGNDGVWLTEDDVINGYSITIADETLNTSILTSHDSPGFDDVWYTEDDRVTFREVSTNDGYGNIISVHQVSSGSDKIIDTEDDHLVSFRVVHQFDDDEHKMLTKYVENFGLENEFVASLKLDVYKNSINSTDENELIFLGIIGYGYLSVQEKVSINQVSGVFTHIREKGFSSGTHSFVNLDLVHVNQAYEALTSTTVSGYQVVTETRPLANDSTITTRKMYFENLIQLKSTHIEIHKN